jgi:predicted DNA-binding transcriptional regulator AlpA
MKTEKNEEVLLFHMRVFDVKKIIAIAIQNGYRCEYKSSSEFRLKDDESASFLNGNDLIELISTITSRLSYKKEESIPTINKVDVELWDRNDVAKKLRITLPTLRKWTKNGIIPNHIKIGRNVYYNRGEIIEFLECSSKRK